MREQYHESSGIRKDYVVTQSHDNIAIVWDTKIDKLKQHYKFHSKGIFISLQIFDLFKL